MCSYRSGFVQRFVQLCATVFSCCFMFGNLFLNRDTQESNIQGRVIVCLSGQRGRQCSRPVEMVHVCVNMETYATSCATIGATIYVCFACLDNRDMCVCVCVCVCVCRGPGWCEQWVTVCNNLLIVCMFGTPATVCGRLRGRPPGPRDI